MEQPDDRPSHVARRRAAGAKGNRTSKRLREARAAAAQRSLAVSTACASKIHAACGGRAGGGAPCDCACHAVEVAPG